MKCCLRCARRFDGGGWQCPACGSRPAVTDGCPSFAPALAEGNVGYDRSTFERLVGFEDAHFWFTARNRLLLWALGRFFAGAGSFLEVGCGTGYVLRGVRRAFPGWRLTGSEIYTRGLEFARRRLPDVELIQADARRLPFDREFDVVGAFDVLEHVAEDETVLGQMFQAVRPGGGILVTVPQHPGLWSAADEYACHKRRYRAAELVRKVRRAGFRVVHATSFVSILLPLMAASRWLGVWRRGPYDPWAEFRIGARANSWLGRLLAREFGLLCRGVRLPVGGSLLLAACRPGVGAGPAVAERAAA
jgi:SAM-dependent methyltransferase